MWKTSWLPILAIFIIQFLAEAQGLKCYVCNSNDDSRCNNVPELGVFEQECTNAYIANVSMPPIMCRKVVQIVDYSLGDLKPNTRIIRGCGWIDSNYTGRCYQRSGFGGRQVVCSCTDNTCNSSFVHIPSVFTIVGLLGFLLSFSILS